MSIDIHLQGTEALAVLNLPKDNSLCDILDKTMLLSADPNKKGSIGEIYNTIKELAKEEGEAGKEYVNVFREQIINQLYVQRNELITSEKNYQKKTGIFLDYVLKAIDSDNYKTAENKAKDEINNGGKTKDFPDTIPKWFENGKNPVYVQLTSKIGNNGINKEGIKSDSHICAFIFPNEEVYKKQFDKTYKSGSGSHSDERIVVFQTDIIPNGIQKCNGSKPFAIWGENISLENMAILYSGTPDYKK